MKISVSELTTTIFSSSLSPPRDRDSLRLKDSTSSTSESSVMGITTVMGAGLPLMAGVNWKVWDTEMKSSSAVGMRGGGGRGGGGGGGGGREHT